LFVPGAAIPASITLWEITTFGRIIRSTAANLRRMSGLAGSPGCTWTIVFSRHHAPKRFAPPMRWWSCNRIHEGVIGMKNKVFASFDEAVADIPDGASIATGCWGLTSLCQNLIAAIKKKGAKDLTLIVHNFLPLPFFTEEEVMNLTVLLPQLKKIITPVVGIQILGAGAFVKEYVEKGLEVEFTSHGTLASRLYAGAAGLGGIYNPVGVGTILEKGKEKRVIDGKEYILEMPIRPDYAFVRAHKADKLGNLIYRGVFREDHPVMAMAAKVTIAEVNEIVEAGEIDPEHVVTPGIFVDRIVKVPEGGLGSPEQIKALVSKLAENEIVRKLLFR
jgi:3-oxoacid CoA-transferase subunit A